MKAGHMLTLSSPPFPEFQMRHQARAASCLCSQTTAPSSVLLQDWILLLFAAPCSQQIACSQTFLHSGPRCMLTSPA